MKSTMKKILAVALVLMMALPLVAFPISADETAPTPLYTVNFDGDSVFSGSAGWAGAKVETTQTSAVMYTYYNKKASNLASSVWGADLEGFTILNNSYTVVFTLTASGENEEIGFFPDDWSGFVMTPGKDAYKFVTTTKTGTGGTDGKYEGVIASGTYENNKSLTQTYAIEFATEGTQSADKGATEAVTVYKLYVLIDNKFECVCSLSGDQLDDKYFDWFYDWEEGGKTYYEDDFTLRLYRRGYALNDNYETTSTKIDPSNGTVTVSNMSIYEGLVATIIEIPSDESATPEVPVSGELLYTVNFKGDENMAELEQAWDGFGYASGFKPIVPSTDGSSVTLQIKSGKWATAGAKLEGLEIQNGAYTFVFTVTAGDDDEEVGICLDHATGFVVNPGQNTFRYTSHLTEGSLIETTEYDGTGELTQTYAIAVAGEGEGENEKGQPYVDITTYNLYNLTQDESGAMVWNLACELTEDQLSTFGFDWGAAGDCDNYFYSRLSRDRKNFDSANNSTITVSDFSVYKGVDVVHVHEFELAETTKEATCTEGGTELWSCGCGEEEEREVDALGHDYDDGVVTTEPSVETEGVLTKTCAVCGDVITESIVKTEAETPITDEPLYEVDFNGTDDVFGKIGGNYDGKKATVSKDGKFIELKPNVIPSVKGSVWSGEMLECKMEGNSYTVVFTVDAPDNQSVGIFFKWKDGFFINPMNNTYSVGYCGHDGADVEKYVATTEYDGSGKAVQTYAVEFASGSEANADGKYECSVYKLYVLNDGEWKLICALDADTREAIAWNTTDYEFMIQLARVSEDVTPDGSEEKVYTNTGSVIVSYMKVYEGHVAHAFAFVENKAPTCTEDGYDLYRCECGKEEERNEVSALGHDSADKVTIKEPTCTEDGEEEIGVCTRCGNSIGTQPIPALGHDYKEEITTAPTCTAQGTKTITCTRCDYSATEAIDALGHSYGDWVTTAPTCTEAGFKTRTCATCGDTVKTDIPAIGHDWDEGVVTTAPTLEAEGVLTKTCKNDATHTTTEVIPKQPSDGDLLYEVNFAGDEVFKEPKGVWSGASVKVDAESNTAVYSTKKDSSGTNYRGSAWGADLKGYNLLGNSYTVVFTVEASDLNQEIGFMPCDHAGFVVTPGNNQYRFITTRFNDNGTDGAYEKVIASGEYQTTERSLKQTFAVELKTSGTKEEPKIDAYNLYVLDGTEWKLVCALDSVNDNLELTDFDWFYWENDVYEEDLTMRFYRRCYVLDENGFTTDVLDELQGGTVTVSEAKLYKGLICSNGEQPDDNTDSGNTDSGNTDSGNTDSGNTDSGNTSAPETNAPETSAPETSAPETSTPETEPEAKKGCGGSIAMSGVALVGACAAMLAVKRRKNEDD